MFPNGKCRPGILLVYPFLGRIKIDTPPVSKLIHPRIKIDTGWHFMKHHFGTLWGCETPLLEKPLKKYIKENNYN